ncbi:MAG: hypothetical protein EB163_04960 [Nitrososphaeria archaeon]|nr:hypothetical protein [Nitrososphaeria archaeon]NDB92439.1 hypothetical protein [Nitrososphaeria archaeon]NDF27287.1 hypothetical protein [Nitrosopumilaceae archaeon]
MVFGWGKKKQDSPELATKTILSLDEISSVLSKHKEEQKKQIVTKSKPLLSEINGELDSIYKIIDHLKNDTLKVEDIEKILQVIVVRAKTEVIDVISKESKKPIPNVSTYDDLLKASEASSHTLKKIGDVLGKNSRVIHVFAKKYAQSLKDHLALVTKNNTILTKMLSDYSALEDSCDSILNMVSKIQDASQEHQSTERHMTSLGDSHDSAQKLYESTQKQISDLQSSPEYQSYLEKEDKIKQIKAQEEKLNKEIDDEFSKISRPLGKYVYVTSLDKALKSILEKMVERPSQVIGAEPKESIITILESCMKGIVSGTVSVKEADKSVDQITAMISGLDTMISKKNSITSQLQQIEGSSKFDIRILESLQKQLAKAKSDHEDAQTKIKNLESEKTQNTTQKEKTRQDLESLLHRILGVKYEVK